MIQFEAAASGESGSMVIQYIMVMIAGVAVMSFASSVMFVCWWSACKRKDSMQSENKVPCPGNCSIHLDNVICVFSFFFCNTNFFSFIRQVLCCFKD